MIASADAVEIDGIYYNLDYNSRVATVTKPTSGSYSGVIVIPKSVVRSGATYSVTSIGKSAFLSSSITSVSIPNSVKKIENAAFDWCYKLTSVNIPNSVTTIDYYAFQGCTSLTSIIIPNSVTTIGYSLFKGCTSLTSVTISNSIATIETGTFSGCNSLSSIIIPNSVTTIGSSAFESCTSLKSISIPNSVETIKSFAFNGCTNLETVSIGNGVTSIGSKAFANCDGLVNVYCLTNAVPSTYNDSFDNSNIMNATLHVPESTINDYKANAPWNLFKSIVSLSDAPSYIPGDVNDDGAVSVTDVGCAINYILEQVPSPFVFEAADMNGDNIVSVTDVGMIINIILSDGASRLERNSLERNENNVNNSIPSLSLMPVHEGYELHLESKDAYIGFQFDVELAEGATINDMRMASADDNDHVLTYRQLDNGKWRVVCYSPSNSTFVADDTPLLTITVVGNLSERYFTGNAGTATLGSVAHFSNIRLTTAEFDELRSTNVEGLPTGIASIEQGMKMNVEHRTLCIISDRNATLRLYSLDGCVRKTLQVKKGVNSFDGLRAGIYMINNQKVILR